MSDGYTLTKAGSEQYLEYLASGIGDLTSLFELADLPPLHIPKTLHIPPFTLPDASFDSSMTMPEAYKTPSTSVVPRGAAVGVRLHAARKRCCLTNTLLMLNQFFQPNFAARPRGPVQLLDPETASVRDVVGALNDFYGEFLDLSIQTNLDFANQMEINDGEANKNCSSKVAEKYKELIFIRMSLIPVKMVTFR